MRKLWPVVCALKVIGGHQAACGQKPQSDTKACCFPTHDSFTLDDPFHVCSGRLIGDRRFLGLNIAVDLFLQRMPILQVNHKPLVNTTEDRVNLGSNMFP